MELLVKADILKSLLIAVVAGLWLFWLWTRRNLYRFSFRFPRFIGLPFLGIANRLHDTKYILQVITKLFAEGKQKTINFWLGTYLVMITTDPDIIEKILSSPELLSKARNLYKPLQDSLGGGIIASPVEEWRQHRKLIKPSFSHTVLVSFLPIFHKAKKQMLSEFDTLVGIGEHKLADMLLQTTMKISIETTMGKVMKENDKVDESFAKDLHYILTGMVTQVTLSTLNLQWIYLLNLRFQKAKHCLKSFVHELIMRKLKILHESKNTGGQPKTETNAQTEDSLLSIKKTPNIFIDQALQLYQKQQFTFNDIIVESNTIAAGSTETISTQILSTIVMLALHPDVQQKLFEEIVSLFPEKDFEMEYEHMDQLPYLDMVINETMRLEPPGPLIAREAVKETQLTENILLPKGLLIMISIFHLHRNTGIWGPNAHKFNPDNFLPENLVGKHSYAFIPFSKGARNCIGWRYALFAMKVLLAGCVRNFIFTTTFRFEDLQYLENVTLKYMIEPRIQIHRR